MSQSYLNVVEQETEEDVILDMVDIISQTYWQNQPSEKLWIQIFILYIILYIILYNYMSQWFILLYIRLYIIYM